MAIKEVKINNTVYARLISTDDWSTGLSFFSQDEDFIQVGAWGYDKGKKLLAHIHNHAERVVMHTQEVLYIRKGSIKADIYDANGEFIEAWVAKEGDTVILLHGGHGYEILEDGTQVLEVKNGPYLGAEIDRRRIEIK